MKHRRLPEKIQQGFIRAKDITRKYARTFYFASRFLPADKRYASYAVYSLCRISDEAVDDAYLDKEGRLQNIRNGINLAFSEKDIQDELLLAFRYTVCRYSIPREYFDEFLEGMGMDLGKDRYATFTELADYCYKVAGVVGLIMLRIFGSKNKKAEEHAIELGIAMQLTNILRDIREDFLRGRIYLPLDEMQRHGATETELKNTSATPGMKKLIAFQISRARDYYRRSEQGIRMIDNYWCRFVILAMKENYAKILDEIEDNGCDVFSKCAQVNMFKKIMTLPCIAIKAIGHEN